MIERADALHGGLRWCSAPNACIDAPDLHSVCVSMIEAMAEITPLPTEGLDNPSRWEN